MEVSWKIYEENDYPYKSKSSNQKKQDCLFRFYLEERGRNFALRDLSINLSDKGTIQLRIQENLFRLYENR